MLLFKSVTIIESFEPNQDGCQKSSKIGHHDYKLVYTEDILPLSGFKTIKPDFASRLRFEISHWL